MINEIIKTVNNIFDVDYDEEIWTSRSPKLGDHIRVQRMNGIYYHHGIYVSDEEVIHFTGTEDDSILNWSNNEVIKSDLKFFLNGGILEVREYTEDEKNDLYPPEHIVNYARTCLGDKGYNLIFNNCEHFANVCTLGRFRSKQVERVFLSVIPEEHKQKGKNIMGFFSWLFGSKSSGSSRSSSSSTYTYEPDKVKVAQIESDAKIKLAGLENERIELMKNAQLEILRNNAEAQMAIEEAKARGFTAMAQAINLIQEKMTEIAEKRLLIIEKGSMQVVREIENFYSELNEKIESENSKYNTEKLPGLLNILEKYEPGTPAHNLYMKRISDDMTMQFEHSRKQLDAVLERQSQIISGLLNSKEKMIEHAGEIATNLLEMIHEKIEKTIELGETSKKFLKNRNGKVALPERFTN